MADLSAQEWQARLGPDGWHKMTSACECGPSVDFAEEAAAKALNAAVLLGFIPPEPPPVIGRCPECGPVRFLSTYYENPRCARCEESVELAG